MSPLPESTGGECSGRMANQGLAHPTPFPHCENCGQEWRICAMVDRHDTIRYICVNCVSVALELLRERWVAQLEAGVR